MNPATGPADAFQLEELSMQFAPPREPEHWPFSVFACWVPEAEVLNERIRQTLYEERARNADGPSLNTNVRAWRTDWRFGLKAPGLSEVCDIAKSVASQVSQEHWNLELRPWVDSCWGVIYEEGDHSVEHDHFSATFSVVYYASVPAEGGQLVFPQASGVNSISPAPGLMVVIPGWIRHRVLLHRGDADRVVVALNVFDLPRRLQLANGLATLSCGEPG